MIDIACKYCGHKLALDHVLDKLEPGHEVKIWCVICGRMSVINRGLVRTTERKNKSIVDIYRRWR